MIEQNLFKQLAQEARDYKASKESNSNIRKAMERISQSSAELERARRVDRSVLQEPYTL